MWDFSYLGVILKDKCIACNTIVRPRQEAIQCDGCELWQHRACNTGISRDQYKRIGKLQEDLQWVCARCLENPTDTEESVAAADATFYVSIASHGSSVAGDEDEQEGTYTFYYFRVQQHVKYIKS
ncbi:uncharacterized protein LOC125662172 [Ostrea edulis]|uniref:uncharacterized protein LOC125662172 n=1 Tax=Ostrea edulis TaxID=37623 RepID=UPI0024AEA0FA|nr:uncharacterized protein LOC125662172 [Ostrea edulis]